VVWLQLLTAVPPFSMSRNGAGVRRGILPWEGRLICLDLEAGQFPIRSRRVRHQSRTRGTTMAHFIRTKLEFAERVCVFGDDRMTTVLLDRVTHHRILIRAGNSSWCLAQSKSRENP
jgi:hypothetical protein